MDAYVWQNFAYPRSFATTASWIWDFGVNVNAEIHLAHTGLDGGRETGV